MHKITSGMKQSFPSPGERWFLLAVCTCIFLQLKASDEEHTYLVGTSEEVAQHSTAGNSFFLMLKKVKLVIDTSNINSNQRTVLHLLDLLYVMSFKYMSLIFQSSSYKKVQN